MGKENIDGNENIADFKWKETDDLPDDLQKKENQNHDPSHSVVLVSDARKKLAELDFVDLTTEELTSLDLKGKMLDDILWIKAHTDKYDSTIQGDEQRISNEIQRRENEIKKEIEAQEEIRRNVEHKEIQSSVAESVEQYIKPFYENWKTDRWPGMMVMRALEGGSSYVGQNEHFSGAQPDIRKKLELDLKFVMRELNTPEKLIQYITDLSVDGYFTPEEFHLSAIKASEVLDKYLEGETKT